MTDFGPFNRSRGDLIDAQMILQMAAHHHMKGDRQSVLNDLRRAGDRVRNALAEIDRLAAALDDASPVTVDRQTLLQGDNP